MQAGSLAPYEESLLDSRPLHLVADDGHEIALNVDRWLGPVDSADETVLARCRPPVLDVGCGPGRFVLALAERGSVVLGVDIAGSAVSLTRRRGGHALQRSIFERTPGEGRWPTVLLMDGNVGIGGDPLALLRRVRSLSTATGQVLVESNSDADADAMRTVRFSRDGRPVGPPFPWAEVGLPALRRHADEAGYRIGAEWSVGGRSFALLRR